MITGIILRFIVIFSLKTQFTSDVSIQVDHKLKTDGLYKKIRHLSYSGSLMTFLGVGLTLGNWISLLIVFLSVLTVFIYRINLEEKVLLDFFKDDYKNYQQKTKKIIPYLYLSFHY